MPLTIGFLYPNGAAVTALGIWAVQKGHSVILYCPGDMDPAIRRTVITDLEVHAREQYILGKEHGHNHLPMYNTNFNLRWSSRLPGEGDPGARF